MEREELYMFKKIKFQILTPYDEKMTMNNINLLKQMGVEVENIRQADILDKDKNKIYVVGILICKSQKSVYERVKKIYTNVKMYEGLPTLF